MRRKKAELGRGRVEGKAWEKEEIVKSDCNLSTRYQELTPKKSRE